MRTTLPPLLPNFLKRLWKREVAPGRWNPEYLGPCCANLPLGPAGNPLSEKPDITGVRGKGPESATASHPELPPPPRRAYPGAYTAPGWGEGRRALPGRGGPRP